MAMHETFRLWASVILLTLSLGWTVFFSLWMLRRAAVKGEQDRLAAQLATLETALKNDERADGAAFAEVKSRLQKVEDDIKHLPTKEQVHGLELSMGEMKGDLRELAVSIRPLAMSVERIDNFLMERANRA